ncbi:hypothetical protein HELRODRAFT_170482 [Helobdella robusta]|uniref:Ig-like domain-containing protein n=1 Tax=Helobdella robusta TaxID=6412 RepID=T1F341_HELRO|nr:hypothetical protein HELRODRAFT_170482 [Helobdella robusta]ESO07172.1 hypothetical protein HELRODRAFT_170482 [Helobdella robusta]
MHTIIPIVLYITSSTYCHVSRYKFVKDTRKHFMSDIYEAVPDSFLLKYNNSVIKIYSQLGANESLYCLPNKNGTTKLYKNILSPLIRHRIQWFDQYDRSLFTKSNKTERHELIGGSTLQISTMVSEDTGMYRCHVTTPTRHNYVYYNNLTVYRVASVGIKMPFTYRSNASCDYLLSVSVVTIAELNQKLCSEFENYAGKISELYSECEEPLIRYLTTCLTYGYVGDCPGGQKVLDKMNSLLKIIVLTPPCDFDNFYKSENNDNKNEFDVTKEQAENNIEQVLPLLSLLEQISFEDNYTLEMVPSRYRKQKQFQYFCPVGFYHCFQCIDTVVEHMCLPCKPGTANDDIYHDTCEQCPIDTFQFKYGAKECYYCPENTGTKLRMASTSHTNCTRKYSGKSLTLWLCHIMVMAIVGVIVVLSMLGIVILLGNYLKLSKSPFLTLENINEENVDVAAAKNMYPRKLIKGLKLNYLNN